MGEKKKGEGGDPDRRTLKDSPTPHNPGSYSGKRLPGRKKGERHSNGRRGNSSNRYHLY